jgi:site-specific recombinase XerC
MPALALRLHDADRDLDTVFPAFAEACVLRKLSPRTREWYAYCLGPFPAYARQCGVETLAAVSPQVVRGFLARMRPRGATSGGVVLPATGGPPHTRWSLL